MHSEKHAPRAGAERSPLFARASAFRLTNRQGAATPSTASKPSGRTCDSCGATKQTASFPARVPSSFADAFASSFEKERSSRRAAKQVNATTPARSRSSRKRASTRLASARLSSADTEPSVAFERDEDENDDDGGDVSSLAVCAQNSDGNRQSHATVSTTRLICAAKSNDAHASFATSYTHTWLDPLGSKPKLTNKHEPSALVLTDSIGASIDVGARAPFGAKSKRAEGDRPPSHHECTYPPRVATLRKAPESFTSMHATEPCALSYASASRGAPRSHTSTAPATRPGRNTRRSSPRAPSAKVCAPIGARELIERVLSVFSSACVLSPVSRTTLAFAAWCGNRPRRSNPSAPYACVSACLAVQTSKKSPATSAPRICPAPDRNARGGNAPTALSTKTSVSVRCAKLTP